MDLGNLERKGDQNQFPPLIASLRGWKGGGGVDHLALTLCCGICDAPASLVLERNSSISPLSGDELYRNFDLFICDMVRFKTFQLNLVGLLFFSVVWLIIRFDWAIMSDDVLGRH